MKLIALSQEKYAKVDDSDYDWLMQWKWYAVKEQRKKSQPKWYAVRKGDNSFVYMHRALLETPEDMMTDHSDGDTLNNQRDNLRVCTNAENQHNQRVKVFSKTSRYKGVSWHAHSGCWQSHIMVNNKSISLGHYDSEEDAAAAYDERARQEFGAYASCNFDPPRPVGPRRVTKKTSQFKGVYFDERRQKWQAAISVDGKRKWLGRFSPTDEGELQAAKAVEDTTSLPSGKSVEVNYGMAPSVLSEV